MAGFGSTAQSESERVSDRADAQVTGFGSTVQLESERVSDRADAKVTGFGSTVQLESERAYTQLLTHCSRVENINEQLWNINARLVALGQLLRFDPNLYVKRAKTQ